MHSQVYRIGLVTVLSLIIPVIRTAAQSPVPVPELPFLPPLNRTVLTEKEAFVLGDPEKVTGAFVANVFPSPEGRYALILHKGTMSPIEAGEKQPLSLSVWDNRTRRLRPLWQFQVPTTQSVGRIHWLPGTSIAVTELPYYLPVAGKSADRERVYYSLNLPRAFVRRLGPAEKPLGTTLSDLVTKTEFSVSPSQSLAAFLQMEKVVIDGRTDGYRAVRLQFLGGSGDLSPPISIEDKGLFSRGSAWSADGRTLYLQRGEQYSSVDSRRGTVASLPEKPEITPPTSTAREASLRTVRTQGTLTSGETNRSLTAIWLESAESHILAEADTDEDGTVTLLPDLSALFVRKNGALYTLPIQRYDRDAFLSKRNQAAKERALRQAAQIVGRLVVYGADHGGKLPADAAALADALGEYAKLGVVFPNPTLEWLKIASPSGTMIGYIPAPGGRAQFWADGHVTWLDDPKKP